MSHLPIRVANPPQTLVKEFPEDLQKFYFRLANITYRFLSLPITQKFLLFIIDKEKIEREGIKDVRIMVFPSKDVNQFYKLAGRYNEIKKQISIYPPIFDFSPQTKKLPSWFFEIFEGKTKEDEEILRFLYIEILQTIIHEILHVKYNSGYAKKKGLNKDDIEKKVHKLTEKYMEIFFTRFI